VHGPLALLLLIVSILFLDQRHLELDSFLVGHFAFPPLCRDIPNQPMLFRIGILWFSAFALIAAVIYAAGDRVQHVTPLDKLFVDGTSSPATFMRAN
jgi:ATP/ADP translocase